MGYDLIDVDLSKCVQELGCICWRHGFCSIHNLMPFRTLNEMAVSLAEREREREISFSFAASVGNGFCWRKINKCPYNENDIGSLSFPLHYQENEHFGL